MVSNDYKKRVNVKAHQRYDPRVDKAVDVDTYDRTQHYKKYKKTSSNPPKTISKDIRKANIEDWLNDDTRQELKGLDTRQKKEEFIAYYGTKPHQTMLAIALDKTIPSEQKGVCVEIGEGYKEIDDDLQFLEKLGLLIMVDNGSFKYSQRCPIFNSKKISEKKLIPPEKYFDYDIAKAHSDWIVEEYEKTLKNCKNPENLVIILPELIGSSEITNKLHRVYKEKFKELHEKYGCGVWASLQFNPTSADWKKEAQDSIDALDKLNMPKDWKIGVPYGKDFAILWRGKDAIKNRAYIFNEIKDDMKNKVHLYGCGTINKVEDVKPHRDLITSIDSSSLNAWSRYAHYLNPKYNTIQDIRNLKGKQGSQESTERHKEQYKESSNIPLKVWTEEKERKYFNMISRFIVNFQHFNEYIKEEIM